MCRNCDENLENRANREQQLTIRGLDLPEALPVQPNVIPCGDCDNPSTCEVNGAPYCDDCHDSNFILCNGCRESTPRDEAQMGESSIALYCESCWSDRFCCCDSCGETVSQDDTHSVSHRRWNTVCNDCFDESFFDCADCGDTCHRDNRCSNESGDDICEGCSENYGRCEGCDDTFHTDNLYYSESRGCDYCSHCRPSDDGQFDAKRFHHTGEFSRVGSPRRFGVELETSECDDFMDLEGQVYFGAKEDGSIDGKEFVSTVLSGDAGFDAIVDFCNRANRMGFKVDAKCGFHAHFDVGDLSEEQLRSVAIAYNATYDVWASFVNRKRRDNSYCTRNGWDCDDVMGTSDFRYFAATRDRYQWFNIGAYDKHRTFESRIHSATLNAEKVVNWVAANLRFIDYAAKLSPDEARRQFEGQSAQENFALMSEIWGSYLTEFYRARAEKFGTTYASESTSEVARVA